MSDFVDEILSSVSGLQAVAGYGDDDDDDDDGDGLNPVVGALMEVGFDKGAAKATAKKVAKKLRKRGIGSALPSPPFAQTAPSTTRRAPLGLVEDGSGAAFFSLAAAVGATSTMRGKVSRAYHGNRLLVVPSAPGVVITSIKVGDEEQLAAPNAPAELYSPAALTDTQPDNFSPLKSGIDFSITFMNTTSGAITGTCGLKGQVER